MKHTEINFSQHKFSDSVSTTASHSCKRGSRRSLRQVPPPLVVLGPSSEFPCPLASFPDPLIQDSSKMKEVQKCTVNFPLLTCLHCKRKLDPVLRLTYGKLCACGFRLRCTSCRSFQSLCAASISGVIICYTQRSRFDQAIMTKDNSDSPKLRI